MLGFFRGTNLHTTGWWDKSPPELPERSADPLYKGFRAECFLNFPFAAPLEAS